MFCFLPDWTISGKYMLPNWFPAHTQHSLIDVYSIEAVLERVHVYPLRQQVGLINRQTSINTQNPPPLLKVHNPVFSAALPTDHAPVSAFLISSDSSLFHVTDERAKLIFIDIPFFISLRQQCPLKCLKPVVTHGRCVGNIGWATQCRVLPQCCCFEEHDSTL